MNILIPLAFLLIIGSLAVALLAMLKGSNPSETDERRSRRMAWALTARIGLSVALFLLVLLAYQMGWIHPTGLPVR